MATILESPDSAAPELFALSLDKSSGLPYYRQIVDYVRDLVQKGRVKPGQPFWSEGVIAQKLGVSKMTVRQAFQNLRAEGLLLIEKGKRPVVGTGRILKNFQELRGFTEEMRRSDLVPSTRLLEIELLAPDPEIAEILGLDKGKKAYRIKRLRFANKERIAIETTFLPAHFFPNLEKEDMENQSLYSILENTYKIKLGWSEETLEAVPARAEEARLLRVKQGSPLFSMRRTVHSVDGTPVEYGHSLFRGDRYRATVVSWRNK
ncbi:MAG: GntR family transcriptional regulator [Acidobacteriia bacterium]|nr:GntR family transcriptional regulator [Terriglobia bacterium]